MIRPVTAAWVALAHLIGLGALILASVMNPVTPPQPLRVQLALVPSKAPEASPPRMTNPANKATGTSTAGSTPTAAASRVAPLDPPTVLPGLSQVVTQTATEVKTQATPQVTSSTALQIAPQLATQVPPNAAVQISSQVPPVITSASSGSAPGSVTTSAAQPATGPAVGKPTDSQPRVDASFRGNRPPDYPAISRRMGEQGVVVLRVMIETDGRAAQVVVARSSGSARLDQAAIAAIRQWRFIPAQQGGQPVSQWYDWRWEFRLKD